MSVAVLNGLAEYICPARRFGVWTVHPRTRPWRRVSTDVVRAVAARGDLDYQWELHLEWWEPAADAATEPQSQPVSPGPELPPTPTSPGY